MSPATAEPHPEQSETLRITLAARVFTLAALGASVSVAQQGRTPAFVAVAVIALLAQVVSAVGRRDGFSATVPEGAAVAFLAGTSYGAVVMPYLIVPVLVGGVLRHVRGAFTVLAVEVVAFVTGLAVSTDPVGVSGVAHALVWLITGVGFGLLGTTIHRLVDARGDDRSYQDAVQLIEQLHALSGRLSEGLDVAGTGTRLLQQARLLLDLDAGAVVARTSTGLVPLATLPGTEPGELADATDHLAEVFLDAAPWREGRSITLPLSRDGRVIAALAGRLRDDRPLARIDLDAELAGAILRLDAALMFAEVSASATHEERQRLAREVHDGLAQDLASLGYLLDALDLGAPDAEARLGGIRAEITRVLSEVRHSVFDLRVDPDRVRSLGDSVAALAEHVRTHSPIQVHLRLDESPARLRADVEAQLIRITQEAMSNARRHSGAANLWVHCRVDAPHAEIEVRDDGTGLGVPREDSHGIAIMRERAERIGARLDVDGSAPDHGTRVLVRLGGER